MHNAFPNVVPVANKYIGHKEFLKAQAEHENNVRVIRFVASFTAKQFVLIS